MESGKDGRDTPEVACIASRNNRLFRVTSPDQWQTLFVPIKLSIKRTAIESLRVREAGSRKAKLPVSGLTGWQLRSHQSW